MKFLFPFFLLVLILTGCSHHTIPQGPSATPPVTAPAYTKPMVIVDGHGNILVTEKDLPPEASKDILSIQNAKSFTPLQAQNLAARYKAIPPRILYVPQSFTKKSNRGIYYVYNSKFWYWKKADGYFYLDEAYYK